MRLAELPLGSNRLLDANGLCSSRTDAKHGGTRRLHRGTATECFRIVTLLIMRRSGITCSPRPELCVAINNRLWLCGWCGSEFGVYLSRYEELLERDRLVHAFDHVWPDFDTCCVLSGLLFLQVLYSLANGGIGLHELRKAFTKVVSSNHQCDERRSSLQGDASDSRFCLTS